MERVTAHALLKSPYYLRKNGTDHLAVSSNWQMHHAHAWQYIMRKILKTIAFGHFEDFPALYFTHEPSNKFYRLYKYNGYGSFAKCPIVVPYTTSRGSVDEEYTRDVGSELWNSRPVTFHFMGRYDHRAAYQQRSTIEHVVVEQMPNSSLIYVNTAASSLPTCQFDKCLPQRRCVCKTSIGPKNHKDSTLKC